LKIQSYGISSIDSFIYSFFLHSRNVQQAVHDSLFASPTKALNSKLSIIFNWNS